MGEAKRRKQLDPMNFGMNRTKVSKTEIFVGAFRPSTEIGLDKSLLESQGINDAGIATTVLITNNKITVKAVGYPCLRDDGHILVGMVGLAKTEAGAEFYKQQEKHVRRKIAEEYKNRVPF